MITNRSNASLTCGRSTCKKERLHKANDDYKKRAMKDPIKEAYLNFDNKCRSYRKKLSDSPELLENTIMLLTCIGKKYGLSSVD